MKFNWMYAPLLFLCACTTAPLDSGEDQCLEVCTSEFKVQLEGTPEEFQFLLAQGGSALLHIGLQQQLVSR